MRSNKRLQAHFARRSWEIWWACLRSMLSLLQRKRFHDLANVHVVFEYLPVKQCNFELSRQMCTSEVGTTLYIMVPWAAVAWMAYRYVSRIVHACAQTEPFCSRSKCPNTCDVEGRESTRPTPKISLRLCAISCGIIGTTSRMKWIDVPKTGAFTCQSNLLHALLIISLKYIFQLI